MIKDINEIIEEMNKATSLFLDIVYKLKNNGLKIKNVVLTRSLENVSKQFKEMYSDKVIADKCVGLKIKPRLRKTDNVLAYSYFLDDKRLEKFVYNLERDITDLYNIWI